MKRPIASSQVLTDLDYEEIGRSFFGLLQGELEFAAKKGGKGKGGANKKDCKKGISCGASCVAKTKACVSEMSASQKKRYYALLKKVKAGGGGGEAQTEIDKMIADQAAAKTGQQPEPAPVPAAKPVKPKTPKAKATKNDKPKIDAAQPKASDGVVKLNDGELAKVRSTLIQKHGAKLVDDAEKNVQKILNDSDVFIRVGSTDTLGLILNDRFRTSAELNVTTHNIPNLADKNYQTARNRVEEKTLGYGKNTKPEDRVIYGYYGNSKDLDGVSHQGVSEAYGSIAVKLKRDVKDRSSFTGADSFKSGIASRSDSVNAASLVPATRHGYDRENLPSNYPSYMKQDNDGAILKRAAQAKSVDDLAPNLATTGNAYIEAQIHGGVRPSDIAEIHFTANSSKTRPSAAIAQFAKDSGVDLFVGGKKLSDQELNDIINPPKSTKKKKKEVSDDVFDSFFD